MFIVSTIVFQTRVQSGGLSPNGYKRKIAHHWDLVYLPVAVYAQLLSLNTIVFPFPEESIKSLCQVSPVPVPGPYA